MAGSRLECHVGRQTFGCRQPGPLADQEDNDGRVEKFADVIERSHPSVTDQEWLAEVPAAVRSLLAEERQERGDLSTHGRRGKAIGDHDLKVGTRYAAFAQLGFRYCR